MARTRLTQLRLLQGEKEDESKLIRQLTETHGGTVKNSMRLSVNLEGTGKNDAIGYRARNNPPLIDTRLVHHYDPDDFWEMIHHPRDGRLILNPGDFYILGSRERVVVPPDYAAEMVPFDPAVGEFRIHYAGFFDPGFGYGKTETGTQAVLEVRAHDVPFVIEHGQVIGRIIYSPLIENPEHVYGDAIGSSYQHQGVTLSKQFRATDA